MKLDPLYFFLPMIEALTGRNMTLSAPRSDMVSELLSVLPDDAQPSVVP